MKIQEFEEEIIFLSYDFIAPDYFFLNIIFFYEIPLDYEEYDAIKQVDADFYKKFGTDKTYKPLADEIKQKLNDLFYELSPKHFDLTANNVKVYNSDHKDVFMSEIREFVADKFAYAIPKKPRLVDFFKVLDDDMLKHNEIVEGGGDGNPSIIEDYPSLIKTEIKTRANDLRRIRWQYSIPVFSDEDVFINPRYTKAVARKNRMEEVGISGYEVSPRLIDKQFISIPRAFNSARGNFSSKIRHFEVVKQSTYISHKDRCFIPNSSKIDQIEVVKPDGTVELRNIKRYIYDDNLPDPKIKWDEELGFVGEVYNKSEDKWNNIKFTKPMGFRLPDFRYVHKSFEEHYYNEYMPLFVQLQKYMIDADGNWTKPHYAYGDYDKIRDDFAETINYLRLKPSSNKAIVTNMITIGNNYISANPDMFESLRKEIVERKTEYVDENEEISLGHLKKWIDKREEIYLGKMKNYVFADETTKSYATDFIKSLNKMIGALNLKMETNYPIISLENRSEAIDIAIDYLKLYGYYYTIPNTFFKIEQQAQEPDLLLDRRIAIEGGLADIKDKYIEDAKASEKAIVLTKANMQTYYDDYISEGEVESLEFLQELYKNIILNPEKYSRADDYTKYLNDILTEEEIPDISNIANEEEDRLEEERRKSTEYLEKVREIAQNLPRIEDIKQELTQQDLDNYTLPTA